MILLDAKWQSSLFLSLPVGRKPRSCTLTVRGACVLPPDRIAGFSNVKFTETVKCQISLTGLESLVLSTMRCVKMMSGALVFLATDAKPKRVGSQRRTSLRQQSQHNRRLLHLETVTNASLATRSRTSCLYSFSNHLLFLRQNAPSTDGPSIDRMHVGVVSVGKDCQCGI